MLDPANTFQLYEAFTLRCMTNAFVPWTARDTLIESNANAMVLSEAITNVDDYAWNLLAFDTTDADRGEKEKWKTLERLGRANHNIFGKLLIVSSLPVVIHTHERSVRMRTEINMTRILIALQLYKRSTGKLPDTLDDLRLKALLPDVPMDFFSDKPILYSREKGLLWSVGSDSVDDGGDFKKDFVIKIPNPATVATRNAVDPER